MTVRGRAAEPKPSAVVERYNVRARWFHAGVYLTVLVLLLTVFIAWLVMAGARKGGGPPNGGNDWRKRRRGRDDMAEQRSPEGEHEVEIESEKLANRSR